jgi:hypothetical protein
MTHLDELDSGNELIHHADPFVPGLEQILRDLPNHQIQQGKWLVDFTFTLRFDKKELSGTATASTMTPANADQPRMLVRCISQIWATPAGANQLVEEGRGNDDLDRTAVDVVGSADGVGDPVTSELCARSCSMPEPACSCHLQ